MSCSYPPCKLPVLASPMANREMVDPFFLYVNFPKKNTSMFYIQKASQKSNNLFFFFLNDPPPTELYPLPPHDPLPIQTQSCVKKNPGVSPAAPPRTRTGDPEPTP